MSQHNNLPVPPSNSMPRMPEHMVGYIPFGHEAVITEEERYSHALKADWHDESADFSQKLGHRETREDASTGKEHPYHAGRLVLERITDGEQGTDETRNVALINRHAADSEFEQSLDKEMTRDGLIGQLRANLMEFETFNRGQEIDGVFVESQERKALNEYLEKETPVTLQAAYTEWTGKLKREGRTDEPDMVMWISQIPDDQMLNFVQWHNHRTEKMNANPEVQERIDRDRENYKAKIVSAVMAGELPASARNVLLRVDNTRVILGDIFDTTLQNTLGYHYRHSNTVVVDEGYETPTFDHEMHHATLGWLTNEYLNEAMTEHLTLAMEDSDYATIEPKLRTDQGSYENHRRLLATVLTAGKNAKLYDQAVAAYIEADDTGPENVAFQEALNESFGGVDMNEFIDSQVREGGEAARSRNPKISHDEMVARGVSYAARGVELLGFVSRGGNPEKLKHHWAADRKRNNSAKAEQLESVVKYFEPMAMSK